MAQSTDVTAALGGEVGIGMGDPNDPLNDIDYKIAGRCFMDWLPWILFSLVVGGGLYLFVRYMFKMTFRG